MLSDDELPPLPNKEKLHTVLPDDYRYGHIYGYTADQMREYARAVDAQRMNARRRSASHTKMTTVSTGRSSGKLRSASAHSGGSMTDAQQALAQVREALAAGPTPGPWQKATDWSRAAVIQSTKPFKRVVCTGNQNNDDRFGAEDWSGATWVDADFIARCNPENMRAILAHVDAQAAENEQLREMLAHLYAGSALYCDDGELQDNRASPFIDFKRDSVADIRSAMVERGEQR